MVVMVNARPSWRRSTSFTVAAFLFGIHHCPQYCMTNLASEEGGSADEQLAPNLQTIISSNFEN
jgi:hypothetical protein